jgi:hypothetical protein
MLTRDRDLWTMQLLRAATATAHGVTQTYVNRQRSKIFLTENVSLLYVTLKLLRWTCVRVKENVELRPILSIFLTQMRQQITIQSKTCFVRYVEYRHT